MEIDKKYALYNGDAGQHSIQRNQEVIGDKYLIQRALRHLIDTLNDTTNADSIQISIYAEEESTNSTQIGSVTISVET